MKEIVFLIIGPARAGKTTFANFLSEITGLKAAGTSQVVYEVIAAARNCTVEDLLQIPKEELRPTLIKTADYICDIHSDTLSLKLLNDGYRIIDGIRRSEELRSIKSHPKYDVFVVYIDRDPQYTVSDNFNINKGWGNQIIENDGSIQDLEEKALAFFHDKFKLHFSRCSKRVRKTK